MPVNLRIPGVPVESEKRPEVLFPGDPEAEVRITVRHAARMDVAVRGAAPVDHVFQGADEQDVVEIELEGGVKEWMSVSQLREDLAQGRLTRSVRSDAEIQPIPENELRIPPALPGGPRTRGTAGWVIKGLKILGIDVIKPLADAGEALAVRKFEEKHLPGPGLYPCPPDLELKPESIVKPGDLTSPGPYLVFLHGTASSTLGSFGKLAPANAAGKSVPSAEWRDLLKHYPDRIYALQHHTMSVSPIQNAIDLLKVLPDQARLHLVSHSRGGLIGELLARGEIPDADLEVFRKVPGREDDVKLLEEMTRLVREKRPSVERFVRVACPAQGTILASRRLDLYLSVILNLFGLIPVLAASPLYTILKATLLEVARRRMDPARLPGLEAMMPTSPVINLLNRERLTVAGELGVIAGDVQIGGGLRRSLVTFATDLFYLTQHDYVVNTDSMYRGAGREKVYLFFDRGPEVNHFSYFANPSSRNRLHAWLTREGTERVGDLFATPPKPTRELRGAQAEGKEDAPAVFLIPDFLGSTLRDGSVELWPSVDGLARGSLERLADPANGEPEELVPTYDALRDHLAQSYRVKPFPYDGRKSVLEEGRRLAEAVKAELDGGRRVSLLAHGQGGLLALELIASDAEAWKKLREGGGSLILLGTPVRGTHFATRLLLGEEDLVRQLDIVDLARGLGEITEVFAGWPGLLEMLPDEALEKIWWKEPLLAPAGLDRARESRKRLAAALAAARNGGGFTYVAGWAPWTPVSLKKDAAGTPLWEGTAEGDGRVPYALGFAPDSYVEMPHGDLARDPRVLPGLVDILERGSTRQLLEAPPQRARSAAVRPAEDVPQLFPAVENLLAAALGYDLRDPREEAEIVLRVAVVHGDLRHGRLPLAVGHYAGDTIVSAEKILDQELGGALSERYRLGLYPGPQGTFEVVHSPGSTPPGALVIGLGELGELSAAAVTRGVRSAALRYALTLAEQPPGPGESGTWRSAAFSAILIGTGGGRRSISVEDSVAAVVRGALEANRVLKGQGFWERVRIDGVELFELYEPVAIQAVRAARRLVSHLRLDPSENERLEVAPRIRRVAGGRIRQPANPYETGWWKRLQILQEERGGLTFEVLTERARTERLHLGVQRALVDPIVASASSNPWYNEATSKTLFELMIPTELKDQAREEADLVLLLDERTVQYPWELLNEGIEHSDPLGTCVGLIRQLRTEQREFRAEVRPPRDRFALVVGDPPSELVELPGAQAEAREVETLLMDSAFTVVPLIRRPAGEVIRELVARDYQILHLAGHGHYDPLDPEGSGMVLGDGAYLTSVELGQLRAVPPFVFVNCCHLGQVGERTQTGFHRLAASLALQLVRMGVRALVVAGWAVHDHVAPVFARTLYQEMLAGETFGRAVLRARRKAYETDPASNTWGAYQCYGDPAFVLDLRRAREQGKSERDPYAVPRQLLEELIDLRPEAQKADTERNQLLRDRLDRIEEDLPDDWRDGELLAALGNLRRDLGEWEKAMQAYDEAFRSWGATASLKTVETLTNLETRWAEQLRKEPREGQDPAKLFRDALGRIEALLALGRTPERLSLAGSAYKRLALAAAGEERKKALRKAASFYQEAHELTLEQNKSVDPYPALNWIACRIALGNIRQHKAEVLTLIKACSQEGERLAETSGQFFHRLHPADALLHGYLVEGTLASGGQEEQDAIAKYRKAVAGQAGATERSSVAEHLEFLAEMLPNSREVLDRIRMAIGTAAP